MTKEQLLSNLTSREAMFMLYNTVIFKMNHVSKDTIGEFEATYNDAAKSIVDMLAFDQIKNPKISAARLCCMVEAMSIIAGRNIHKVFAEEKTPVPQELDLMCNFAKTVVEIIFSSHISGYDMNGFQNADEPEDMHPNEVEPLIYGHLKEILVLLGRAKAV